MTAGLLAFIGPGGADPARSHDEDGSPRVPAYPREDTNMVASDLGKPCRNGTVVGALSTLRAIATTPIWAPAKGVVTNAWTCGSTPVLVYDGPIEVSYEAGWSNVEIPAKWESLATTWGGRTATLAGRPAYISQPTGDTPRRQIMLVEGDILVRLLADKAVSEETLIEMADSIPLP